MATTSSNRVIAVIGATGTQGGSLARAILEDPGSEFSVRAITRNPESANAAALAAQGAEIVKADLDDVDSLRRGFAGAYGAFCVTNFWEHFSPEKELLQATNMAEAASTERVRHVIWSTLEDTRRFIALDDDRMPTLMGSYKVPHFDAKGEADEVFREKGVPTTFLLTSFYWDNFVYFGMGPQKVGDGPLEITFPMGDEKLPGIAARDIGRCAYGIFTRGSDLIGSTIGIAGEHLTGAEMAAMLGEALGVEVVYNDVPPEVYRSFDFDGADDLGNMFQFNRDFSGEFCAARSVAASRSLNPSLQSFREWLEENAAKIPV